MYQIRSRDVTDLPLRKDGRLWHAQMCSEIQLNND